MTYTAWAEEIAAEMMAGGSWYVYDSREFGIRRIVAVIPPHYHISPSRRQDVAEGIAKALNEAHEIGRSDRVLPAPYSYSTGDPDPRTGRDGDW